MEPRSKFAMSKDAPIKSSSEEFVGGMERNPSFVITKDAPSK